MKVSESSNALFTNSRSFGYSQTKERGSNDCNKQSHCVDQGMAASTETGQTVENNGQESKSVGTHLDVGMKAGMSVDIPLVGSANMEASMNTGVNTNQETKSGKNLRHI